MPRQPGWSEGMSNITSQVGRAGNSSGGEATATCHNLARKCSRSSEQEVQARGAKEGLMKVESGP